MRLLISCIPFDGGRSGISVYTREVVRELAAQGHSLTLLVEPATPAEAPATPGLLRAPRWTRRPALSMLWHLLCLPFWLRRHRRDFDGFVICAANRRVCAWYPIPTTATIHDLANFHVPGKYSRSRMLYLARVLPFFAKRAHHLVAISESTKSDMVRFWRVPPSRVTVLYDG
ncbi:MAG: glycosyltransferase, partial [Kiritimatiellae bacterium]|nr:glycosyltransferase [Kiritimatiellia bacterium]